MDSITKVYPAELPPVLEQRVFFFEDFIYLLERGEGRKKERERNIDVQETHSSVASATHPNWTSNLQPIGMCLTGN